MSAQPGCPKVLVCHNKTCKQQGSPQVLKTFQRCVPPEILVEASGCLGQCGNGPMVVVLTEGIDLEQGQRTAPQTPIKDIEPLPPKKTWHSHVQPADAFAISAQHFKPETALNQNPASSRNHTQSFIGIWIVGIILFLSLCALIALVVGGPSHYG